MGPEDQLWLESDTEAALAFFREEANRCSGCGIPRDVGMDPANESRWIGTALTCHACAAADRTRNKLQGDPDAITDGVFYIPIERKT